MRKPNGYGSIKRLSGNRRRPFVFVISVDGKQKPVEYFSTQVEAEIFQADYNKLHFHRSLPDHRVTLAEHAKHLFGKGMGKDPTDDVVLYDADIHCLFA